MAIGVRRANQQRKGYGTFGGVFVPTLLTILGVIMYLRLGWVIGNAGLGAGIAIILVALLISGATGLSLSSVTTNIRIGAGGAYSIISRSLGIEVAGSIGIPLFLAQSFAVALYVFGFRTGWQVIFPTHPDLAVDAGIFLVLLTIALISAGFAFRVQFVILALFIAALVSVAATVFTLPLDQPVRLIGDFPGAPETGFQGTGFWAVFAIFFPAATGIMAGANMSGELATPRRSIPVGTMSAIAVATVVYLSLAVWFARVATPTELVTNYTIMLDRAAWTPAVLAGLLGSTTSAALSSLVGASRILQALAAHKAIPGAGVLGMTTARGEPRNAVLVTALVAMGALLLRDLNAVAALITMFFLITYAMVNGVVLLEQGLGLVSFRPLLRIPRAVALIGAVGCIFAMFVINPVFSLIALAVVVAFYTYLTRRRLAAPYGDVRSSLFVAVAEWAVKKASRVGGSRERAWKPNLLVPVEDADELRGTFRLIHDIASPKGSLTIMGLAPPDGTERLSGQLADAAGQFRDEEVFATETVVETDGFASGFLAGMGALRGAFFKPNTVFLPIPGLGTPTEDRRTVIERARDYGLGSILFADHPRAGLGRRHMINVWVRNASWERGHEVAELDLLLLLGYKLQRNWNGRVRLLTVVPTIEEKPEATAELHRLIDLARLRETEPYAIAGTFEDALDRAPQTDLSLLGLPADIDFDWMRRVVDRTRSASLFVRGSGEENALG
jgi:solute carrier family 12 (sodium/potassium/chloride transporter), member 2